MGRHRVVTRGQPGYEHQPGQPTLGGLLRGGLGVHRGRLLDPERLADAYRSPPQPGLSHAERKLTDGRCHPDGARIGAPSRCRRDAGLRPTRRETRRRHRFVRSRFVRSPSGPCPCAQYRFVRSRFVRSPRPPRRWATFCCQTCPSITRWAARDTSCTGWSGVLAGTSLANEPLQTVSLAQVLADPTASARFESVPLSGLDVSSTPLASIPLASIALAGTPLRSVPLPGAGTSATFAPAGLVR